MSDDLAGLSVSINHSVVRRGRSGTAHATAVLARALSDLGASVEFVVPPALPDAQVRRALRVAVWELGTWTRRATGEVLISPAGTGVVWSTSRRHVLVMHDLMVLKHPRLFDPRFRAYAAMTYGPSVRSADLLLTGTYSASREITSRWRHVPPVHVLRWPPVRSAGGSMPDAHRANVVLCVGSTEPHKRHVFAIEVVRLARALSGERLRLLLVGFPGRSEREVRTAIERCDPHHEWIDRRESASDELLDEAYRTSACLLQTSQDEGYGLPLVEAAHHGLPVLHADVPAMNELLPGSAVEGRSPTHWATRLLSVLSAGPERRRHERDVQRLRQITSGDAFRQHVFQTFRSF